jgi:hypothetical protein
MDDLALNDVALILDANMNADVSIETHIKYDKLLVLSLFKIYVKPNNYIIEIKNPMPNSNKIKT